MKMRKAASIALAASMAAGIGLMTTGCNKDYLDWTHLEFNYVVVDGVLHEIASWSDSESDSVAITTKCCNDYILTSTNKSLMTKNKPLKPSYQYTCEEAQAL